MRLVLRVLFVVALLGCLSWIAFGRSTMSFPVRIGIAVGIMIPIGILYGLTTAFQRRRRLERNRRHYTERGDTFVVNPSIRDVFHDASLFHKDNVRIEQLARGKSGKTEFDVFDLSYDTTSSSSEGGTTTHTLSQTVASIPDHGRAGVHVYIVPLRGMSGYVLRLFGLTGSVTAAPGVRLEEQSLANWFHRRYAVVWGDEASRQQVECLLNPSLLTWLQRHHELAFEIADRQLLVWQPDQIVDSTARDGLVEKGLDLASLLQQETQSQAPALVLASASDKVIQGLFSRIVIAGLVSWLIAAAVLFASFYGVVAAGWAQYAPLPTMVGVALFAVGTWIVSGVWIFKTLTRRAARKTRTRA